MKNAKCRMQNEKTAGLRHGPGAAFWTAEMRAEHAQPHNLEQPDNAVSQMAAAETRSFWVAIAVSSLRFEIGAQRRPGRLDCR
jgi:hypothetical protein